MTSPTRPGHRGGGGVDDTHICAFLENRETSALPYLHASYPLLIVHVTEPFKFARLNGRPAGILGATKYSAYGDYTIWEIPISEERLFDFEKRSDSAHWVDQIISLIVKYKIVYFVKLPVDYHKLFEDVISTWSSKGGYNAGMPEYREKH